MGGRCCGFWKATRVVLVLHCMIVGHSGRWRVLHGWLVYTEPKVRWFFLGFGVNECVQFDQVFIHSCLFLEGSFGFGV